MNGLRQLRCRNSLRNTRTRPPSGAFPEDRCVPCWARFLVSIAVLRQEHAKVGVSLMSQMDLSPSGVACAGRMFRLQWSPMPSTCSWSVSTTCLKTFSAWSGWKLSLWVYCTAQRGLWSAGKLGIPGMPVAVLQVGRYPGVSGLVDDVTALFVRPKMGCGSVFQWRSNCCLQQWCQPLSHRTSCTMASAHHRFPL